MSKKFHISKDGQARQCRAKTIESCRASGDSSTEHFGSMKEAQNHYENSMKDKTFKPVLPSLDATSKSLMKENKIRMTSNIGEIEAVDGDLADPMARAALATGLCGDLALNIHEKTGKPFVFVFHSFLTKEKLVEKFEEDESFIYRAAHVMVRSAEADDCFVDAYGQKTFDEVEELYEGIVIVEGTSEMGRKFAGEDYKRFSKFADSAIALDRNSESYDYDFDEYSDDDDDDDEDEDYDDAEDENF